MASSGLALDRGAVVPEVFALDPLEMWFDAVCLDTSSSIECSTTAMEIKSVLTQSIPIVAFGHLSSVITNDMVDIPADAAVERGAIQVSGAPPPLSFGSSFDGFWGSAHHSLAGEPSISTAPISALISAVDYPHISTCHPYKIGISSVTTKGVAFKVSSRGRDCALKHLNPKQLRRKDKQRGYERTYRGRLRQKRVDDEALWLRLEVELRALLTTKRAVNAVELQQTSFAAHGAPHIGSTNDELRSELVDLLHQTRALQEEEAMLVAAQRWVAATRLWSGQTKASCFIRHQLLVLQDLPGCPALYGFEW